MVREKEFPSCAKETFLVRWTKARFTIGMTGLASFSCNVSVISTYASAITESIAFHNVLSFISSAIKTGIYGFICAMTAEIVACQTGASKFML